MSDMRAVYTAQSKYSFYCRDAVCEFVLHQGLVPLNPFKLFDYFLSDRVDRNLIREANRALISHADELWVFGREIADGVWLEILQASDEGKPINFYTIGTRASEIELIDSCKLTLERGVTEKLGISDDALIELAARVQSDETLTTLRR
jgi:hypothetical protein